MKAKPFRIMVRPRRFELRWDCSRWYLKPIEVLPHGVGACNINNLQRPDKAQAPPDHMQPLHKPLR
jgi:hypothetical protein